MPHMCSVPGCRTNYRRKTKNDKVDSSQASVFRFPKDPQRRAFWLSVIPGMHDFTVTQYSRVCSKHFLSKFLSKRFHKKELALKLSLDAYPTIFPNVTTAQLSLDGLQIQIPGRNLLGDVQNGSRTEIENWLSTDKVTDFPSFCKEAESYLDFGGDKWISELDKEQEIESIRFFLAQEMPDKCSLKSFDPKPCFTVTVSADMHVKVHSKISGDIPENSMNWIFGNQSPPVLVYWSQFVTVICQCSVGFWVDHNDSKPSVCINDLHKLPPLEKQDLTTHSSVGDIGDVHEMQSIHTADFKDGDSHDGRHTDKIQQLTLQLSSALFQRSLLLKMMKSIQDLANINLDILGLSLIMNSEGKEEMEKIHRLVQAIMNHAERMNAGLDVLPVWMEEHSELIQKDDLFQVSKPPSEDCEEMNGNYFHSDNDNNVDEQSLAEVQDSIKVEVTDAGDNDDSEMSVDASEQVNKNENGPGFTCEICANGRRFSCLSGLQSHQRSAHKIKLQLQTQCEICGKKFNGRNQYLNHIAIHSDERPFLCALCGKSYKCRGDFKRHEVIAHSKEKKHTCSICGKKFHLNYNLKQHLKTHTDVKAKVGRWGKWSVFKRADNLYHCEFCDKGCKTVHSLKWHLAHHSDAHPFKCITCGKSFKWYLSLQRHQRTVHEDERPFGCSLCDKKFKGRTSLKAHQLVHAEQGEFECDICERRFKWRRSLQKHRARHKEGEGLYQCSLCLQKFKQKEDLTVHEQMHVNDNLV